MSNGLFKVSVSPPRCPFIGIRQACVLARAIVAAKKPKPNADQEDNSTGLQGCKLSALNQLWAKLAGSKLASS